MSELVVALDVGKTNLRAEVRERGRCRLRLGEGVRGWMGAPGPRAALLTQLAEVCGRLPDAGSLTSAGAGIAGYDAAAAEEKDEVSRALRRALPRARIRVASDARTELGALVAASASPAGLFGRFASDVLEAWLAGDEQAGRITEHAAAHLAAAAIAVLRRLDAQSRRFAVIGGLSMHPAFTAAVTSRVITGVPGAVRVPARGDALDGAALLASGAVLSVPSYRCR